MVRKLFYSIFLLGLLNNSTYAETCSILMIYDDKIQTIIDNNSFEFKGYDRVCRQLKQANAGINITTGSAINERQTTAVAVIRLQDTKLPIPGGNTRSSMWSSPLRTTKNQDALIWSAINEATSAINQSDIDGLNENRKKLGFKTYP
ncbi:hypothetical protein [Acinetobacter sp. NIPH 298]|uniref:hypothetical protein n=1 Tax=Acinetobacter sp. NIPH 298 TaxID=1217692 RepID=UPI0003A3BFF3|nr:hypothetical protein [Acinetobacter sp. NIPH 298]